MEPEVVTFQLFREITNDFSDKLGQGSFGEVYKGVTHNGQDVAVKVLNGKTDASSEQFKNEIYNLAMIKHPNIVQILGYCYEIVKKTMELDGKKLLVEDRHRAICLEYLHNGSLQEHLSDEFRGLDWETRFKIIKGTCGGLNYILRELEEPLYHLDIKPRNILLDEDMMPKIADFGLSKIFAKELKKTTHCLAGTLGYQPPEYFKSHYKVSEKFDIFSLGVVIIQIVSGTEGYKKCHDMPSEEFIKQVKTNWRNRLKERCSSEFELEEYCRQVETCTQIGLNCVLPEQERPDIVTITNELNNQAPKEGSNEFVSSMEMNDNKKMMGKESGDTTTEQQNINLMPVPELEFVNALETSSDVVAEHIVGRTEEKNEIMALMEGTEEKFVILPIHGIGGIGKTTFARMVYNDQKFQNYSRVWVDVSKRLDVKEICESIVSQLSGKQSLDNNRQMLHSFLKTLLPGKKILIVLDDLREVDQFLMDELNRMLYHGDSSIIILVTTRPQDIADGTSINLRPYKLPRLTKEMCWDIIKQRSGFETRDDQEQLMDIGLEIAQKCCGVALVAQSLGFTLRSKNFDQWLKVKRDMCNEHLSTDDASLPKLVLESLMISYRYMAPCLQQCFIYCTIFPKGHKIVKNDLTYQWISMDLVKPTRLLSKMHLCDKYIVQLHGLSFFQHFLSPKTSEGYHEPDTIFTMHDLAYDLANSLLGDQSPNQRKEGNETGSSCQYTLLTNCTKRLNISGLEALRFVDCWRTQQCSAAFAPAKSSLRVLDLQGYIQKLPDRKKREKEQKLTPSIGQLEQLRYLNAQRISISQVVLQCVTKLSNLIYLNLHGSSIVKLPESIGELKSLMHLDLSDCSGIQQLPVSFRNLEKLAHLNLSNCYHISGVSEFLGSLSRLEHLNLKYCRNIGDLTGQLGGLIKLRYLNLARVPLDKNLRGLPQVLVNLTKLSYLNLENCLDKDESDNVLEGICKLSNLEHLDLYRNSNLYRIPETIMSLSKLHTLNLSCCTELERLPASISGIDSLRYLHVSDCSSLDKSTLPQYRKSLNLLPNFVVHAGVGDSASNICQLKYENPNVLDIIRLENVKSAQEAQRIKMEQKWRIKELGLVWTRDGKRFVNDDTEVLEQLAPPKALKIFVLQGYNSVSFPSWMTVDIATCLPRLEAITLRGLPSCNKLPPLGQLPNLKFLNISQMDNIRKIDEDFYGGPNAFPELGFLSLHGMECLEEWNTAYSQCEDEDLNQLVLPKLRGLYVKRCPKLSFKSGLPLGNKYTLSIFDCDEVILSSLVGRGHASTNSLHVHNCKAPLGSWNLLRHLSYLKELRIENCNDLTCSSEDILQGFSSLKVLSVTSCESTVLPGWLGDLISLEKLEVSNCKGIRTLPEGIQQLTCLKLLEIIKCPELVQGCKSGENKKLLAHIKEIILDGEQLNVIPSQRGKPRKNPQASKILDGGDQLNVIGSQRQNPNKRPKEEDDPSYYPPMSKVPKVNEMSTAEAGAKRHKVPRPLVDNKIRRSARLNTPKKRRDS